MTAARDGSSKDPESGAGDVGGHLASPLVHASRQPLCHGVDLNEPLTRPVQATSNRVASQQERLREEVQYGIG
jgi:hypothetical protein